MLSTQYRLKLEFICNRIANGEEVKLEDIVWAQKLAKANTSAREMLKKARRQSAGDIQEGSIDDFSADGFFSLIKRLFLPYFVFAIVIFVVPFPTKG